MQSQYFAVGSVVPWAKAGVGAVATQAAGVAVYGPQVLERLEGGSAPAEAIAAVLADDEDRETRQLGAVAADGRAASHTGAECLAWAGHRIGDGYAVQGNILAGEAVVTEMERAFLETDGSLAERLVSALEAGQAAGGDSRGQQSAAIVVEREGAAAESREGIDRVCELRVEDHPEPIAELRRLLGIHLVWDALRRATACHEPGRYAEGAAILAAALRRARRGRDAALRPRLLRVACRRDAEAGSSTSPGSSISTRACAARIGPTRTSQRSQTIRVSGRCSARLACGLDLYEYQGKELFAGSGSRFRGRLATTPAEARAAAGELGGQVVVKAQVLTGGRGKAGGIKLAERSGRGGGARLGDPRARHPRPRRPQALDREGLGDREGVLPLGHVRPGREEGRCSCSRRRAGWTSRRWPRPDAGGARPAARRSARGLPAVPGPAPDLRRGHRRSRRAEADRVDRRPALRGLRRLRRDALRDQPADRHAGGRGEGARLEVHRRRQRALPARRHRRDARPGGVSRPRSGRRGRRASPT